MGPDEPIRVALVGFGLAGEVFHAPLIAATPGMALASVVTNDPGRRDRARRAHEGVRILPSAETLWDGRDEHDLVVVATPNRSHVPLGLAALEAGLPVVIDKPMAPSAEEGRRLLATAKDRGLFLTVFQNRRWDGDFLTVRRLLAGESLGPIVRFESRFERWRPDVQEGKWRERAAPEEAGGLLFDLGSHLIDQAVSLFGRPSHVYAEVDRRRPGGAVDDDVFVALTHGAGVRTHLWMSFLAPVLGPRMRILGLSGGYEKRDLDVQEDALRSGMRPEDPSWGREPPDRWGRLVNGQGEWPIETEPGAWPEFYRGVAESLTSGGPPPVDPEDAVGVLEIIEGAFQSARTGTVIAMEARRERS
jgi:predicted dehydrogenase